VPYTVAYRDALRRLGAELQCASTEEAILEVRNSSDPASYANRLLERSGVGVLLLDHGYSSGETFTFLEHQAAIRMPQREIVRLETLAERLIEPCDRPDDWFAAVRLGLREAVRDGAAGVKTIAAYRASLRLRPVDRAAIAASYTEIKKQLRPGGRLRLTGDALCHPLLFEAALECLDLDVPLQVHCGFGDPDEDLAEASPLGLRPLFDRRYEGLRIVLLHCYPFHREAAYLCAVYPDVYMDLSLTIPLAGREGVRALQEALGLCPWSKLLYASDASRLPELYFVAGALHREALAFALGELVERGTLVLDEGVEAGVQVLRGNARRVYRLT